MQNEAWNLYPSLGKAVRITATISAIILNQERKKNMKNLFKKLTSTMLAVLTLISLLTIPSNAASYSVVRIPEGDYFICPSSNSSYAIDVINNSHTSGTYVHLYNKSDGNAAQIFTIEPYEGDWYFIKNKSSGLCLNVPYAQSNNGQRLWVHSKDTTDASLWRFAKASSNTYIIQNKAGRVIDLDNNICSNGSRIHLWDLHGGASCRWQLKSASANKQTSNVTQTNNQTGKIVPAGCYFNCKTYDKGDNDWYGYHDININVSKSTPVYAPFDGKVVFKQNFVKINGKNYLYSYGNSVTFTSSDGVYKIVMAHLDRFKGVTGPVSSSMTQKMSSSEAKRYGYKRDSWTSAKTVSAGTVLGYIGTTGNSSAVHLHVEVYKQGQRVDPTTVFSGLTR